MLESESAGRLVTSFRPKPASLPVFLRPLSPMLRDTKGPKYHLIHDPVSAVIEIDTPRRRCRYLPLFIVPYNTLIVHKVLLAVHSNVDVPQLLKTLPHRARVIIVHAIADVSRRILDGAGPAYPIGAFSAALRSMSLN